MNVTELRETLKTLGQDHLLQHWNSLSEEKQRQLYDELTSELDVSQVVEYYKRATTTAEGDGDSNRKLDDRMEPLSPNQCGSVTDLDDTTKREYENLAFREISNGTLAILLLAGGQGTRLGFAYPKGMYDVGLPSRKSLFQLQAERILKLEQLSRDHSGESSTVTGRIVWYIMTSPSTFTDTTKFFVTHSYFGLDPDHVIIFQQGTIPCFDFNGRIILSDKHRIARSPDGNGGLYKALKTEGILDDMKRRRIRHIQLYCVDNILVRVGDPIFTGFCISKNAECGNKVVAKGYASESVGVTCMVDGRPQVVEYSEITERASEMTDSNGTLIYNAANICIHYFSYEFLDRICNEYETQLRHHVAKKKIPFVDIDGSIIIPKTNPNGIKMEKFVFDVFKFAKEFVVWECIRHDEFAPLKNADGANDFTPTHCRNSIFFLHRKWLQNSGVTFIDTEGNNLMETNNNNNNKNEEGDDGKGLIKVEISPLISYAGEGLDKNHMTGKEIIVDPILGLEIKNL